MLDDFGGLFDGIVGGLLGTSHFSSRGIMILDDGNWNVEGTFAWVKWKRQEDERGGVASSQPSGLHFWYIPTLPS